MGVSVLSVFCVSCGDDKNKQTSPTKEKPNFEARNKALENKAENAEKNNGDITEIEELEQKEVIPFLTEYAKKHPENRIQIKTEFGDITVELFTDTPLHRANFIRLAELGYFDTSFFHRVDSGFVIQGGNSDRWDTQEFRAAIGHFLIPSEVSPEHPHVRGAFSMAKFSEQNISDASSPFEFFIVQGKNGAHHLDGEHTVFGKVVAGMDVVDSIARVETGPNEWPVSNVYMDVEVVE
jgi:peptidylprolyl isomerase